MIGTRVTHRRYVPYSHAHYAGNLVDGAYSLGLFGAGRLIVVQGVEKWKKADAEALDAYLADPVGGQGARVAPWRIGRSGHAHGVARTVRPLSPDLRPLRNETVACVHRDRGWLNSVY